MTRIAIVGGGIGGLTTAIALRHFGFEPEVYEQAAALLDVGAAIAIWANAMRVFEQLGIANTVREAGGEIKEIRWLDQTGRPINRVSIAEAGKTDPTPSVALHRADLQEILLQALPQSSIHLGCSLVEFRQEPEQVVAHFANGYSTESEFLVGTDGIHSRVRTQLIDEVPPTYRGYTVWRGIASANLKSIPAGTAIEVHGRGKRFGLGPVGPGKLGWWASANAANTSPKVEERSSDRTTWKLGENVADFRRTSDTQSELLRLFEGWYRPAIQLIESTPSASILRTGSFDRVATRSWGERKITLLGDAIHPTTPNLGQGGCMAIEDAMILSRCFNELGASEKALRAYEQLRYRRTTAVARYSRIYGAIGQWENILARGLRRTALSLVPETLAQRLMRVVFDYNACNAKL